MNFANDILRDKTQNALSALDTVLDEYEQLYNVKRKPNKKNQYFQDEANNLEDIMINSKKPIKVKEHKKLPVIEVNGIKGYWINKDEVANWQGKIPIEKFPINFDRSPKIIRKKNDEKIDLHQWIGVNFLRPPTPPPPGDIIIREEAPTQAPPLSPIIRREVYYVYKHTCKKVPKKKTKEPKKYKAISTNSCENLARYQPVSQQVTLSGSYPITYPAVQQQVYLQQQSNYMASNLLAQQQQYNPYYRSYYY